MQFSNADCPNPRRHYISVKAWIVSHGLLAR